MTAIVEFPDISLVIKGDKVIPSNPDLWARFAASQGWTILPGGRLRLMSIEEFAPEAAITGRLMRFPIATLVQEPEQPPDYEFDDTVTY